MDLDGPEGEESWRALVTAHASPPDTAEVKTSNGRYLYFTANSPINCSTKRIAPGIDVRGDGGYVVAPPSVHPSGAVYRWLITGPVAPAPAWLIELAQKRPEPPIPISQRLLMQQAGRCRGSPNAYGAAALDQEIAALAAVPPGSRNHALNRTSFVLHQLVAGGELDAGEVERRLWDAATANG